MRCAGKLLLSGLMGVIFSLSIEAQRIYAPQSVLSSGTWFKIAVGGEGIHKMDVPFLNSLGLTGTIASSQIRLFGRDGAPLSEAGGAAYVDDLQEIALQVSDGGDGVLNGTDQVLFYSRGPHHWRKDSARARFRHVKNLYSEVVYYYLTVGGTGKRMAQGPAFPSGPIVTSFDERWFHESDSVNFLSSGKEWFGQELSDLPGRSTQRSLLIPSEGIIAGAPFHIHTSVAARTYNAASRFFITLNNTAVQDISVSGVSGGIYDLFARTSEREITTTAPVSPVVSFRFQPGSFNAQGWLNWTSVFFRRGLNLPASGQLLFRDWSSVGNNSVTFRITGAEAGTQVWDVTDPFQPVRMNASLSANQLAFNNDATRLREYAAFGNMLPVPKSAGRVPNQNLHQATETDYLIITYPAFAGQAERLAGFHRQRGLRTVVVTTDQVYNEFSAGQPDPTAIRDFVKMYYDRYRATWGNTGKYLLLFGRASFDYKERVADNTNFVPAYESIASLDPLTSYTSDDFFGFLDDMEDINATILINTLDIGIGRVPVKNAEEAKNFVDKVFAYHAPPSFGPWRNHINFIADDEDFNLHLQDAELLSNTSAAAAPAMNIYKIYLDAFRQEGGSGGGRYPQANSAINNNINQGTLIWNYSGHGGPQRLAEEVVIDQQIVNAWNNANRLPLFITATCDFAPYDQPNLSSLGENLLVRPLTGAIALMTTTRVVFAFSNRVMNDNYLRIALQREPSGRYKTLGEAVQAAKNYTYQNSADLINNRKFALLGDPAMTLGFPTLSVQAVSINNQLPGIDTLNATEQILLEGDVRDGNGTLLTGFNGTVFLSLYDKPVYVTTLGNDPSSPPTSFSSRTSTLFKGKVTVTSGRFAFRFRMPKDINYQYGKGKVSLYATDNAIDGNGFNNDVVIGGTGSGGLNDTEGPEVRAWLNDERFVNGSLTNSSPMLIVRLSDSSGINTGSAGIDHDIVATLDDDNNRYFILNDFYETELDSYQRGVVRFQLPELPAGTHTLRIKAWDVLNNSGEFLLTFTVANDDALVIDRVLNYPNPFTTKTSFWFEHNKPGIPLQARVEIYTVTGKVIKTISGAIISEGTRSSDITWDGKDDFGDPIGRGVYLYRLTVQSPDGKKAQKLQRLVKIL